MFVDVLQFIGAAVCWCCNALVYSRLLSDEIPITVSLRAPDKEASRSNQIAFMISLFLGDSKLDIQHVKKLN